MQKTSSADAARPGADPGRMIGGRELPTSPMTTDSDGPPSAAGNLGGPGADPGRIIGGRELPTSPIGGRELPTSPLTTDSDSPPGAAGNLGGRGPPGRCPGPHDWRARAANLATHD